ncbi:MAG: hypothetical protein AAF495_13655 [Pseudomonadota bacterium]
MSLTGLLSLAGCTLQETVQNPLTQRFAWFQYLNGNDIREGCFEGGLWRVRLIYNGRYQEQLRIYNVVADGAGGALLVARAQGAGNLVDLGLSLDDILAPWRWHRSEARLDIAETDKFFASLRQSGFFEPAPTGLNLPSAGFYWIGISCSGGQVHFNAWRYPSDRYAALTFPAFLYARDQTGLTVNPPRSIDAAELILKPNNQQISGPQGTRFQLRVGNNGLAGY